MTLDDNAVARVQAVLDILLPRFLDVHLLDVHLLDEQDPLAGIGFPRPGPSGRRGAFSESLRLAPAGA